MTTRTEVTIATLADEFGITTAEAWRRMEGWAEAIPAGHVFTEADASLARELIGGPVEPGFWDGVRNIVTPNPRPRCRFGRPHVWMLGFYHEGVWVEGHAKCGTCGQIEEED